MAAKQHLLFELLDELVLLAAKLPAFHLLHVAMLLPEVLFLFVVLEPVEVAAVPALSPQAEMEDAE